MCGDGCPANRLVFGCLLVIGTAGKFFFGRDENNVDGGSLRSQGGSRCWLASLACSYAMRPSPSKPHKEKAPAMMGDRGRCWGAMGEMPIFILECLKRIGTGFAKTLIIFLRNAARFWETI